MHLFLLMLQPLAGKEVTCSSPRDFEPDMQRHEKHLVQISHPGLRNEKHLVQICHPDLRNEKRLVQISHPDLRKFGHALISQRKHLWYMM